MFRMTLRCSLTYRHTFPPTPMFKFPWVLNQYASNQIKSRKYCQLLEILSLQGNVVAFALLMTPFATNPLIYVASDPNYRRYPQIDAATISFRESSIKESTACSSSGEIFQGLQRLPLPATTKKLHGWGRYTACYWASHSQFNPTNPRVGQPRPPSEVWDTQWWSSSTPPWPSARATSTRLFSEPPPGPTQPPARLSEPLPEVFLHSQ